MPGPTTLLPARVTREAPVRWATGDARSLAAADGGGRSPYLRARREMPG